MTIKISALPTGQKVGNLLNETLNIGGEATTATTANVTIPRTSATTNTVEPVLALNRQSSGVPGAGIGVSLVCDVETAGGNTERGATIEAVATAVTPAAETFDLVFKTMSAGAAVTERMRILSTGNVTFGATTAGLAHHATGVLRATNGTTGIAGFFGGGSIIASATALPVPTGRVFHVSGTTTITSITSTNFVAGCVITLIFDGILTFTDGGNLKLAGNFVTSADDTITLVYDGTNWYEIARAVN